MWVGIALLIAPIIFIIIVFAFTTYVNKPSTHNATPINSELSNQYYIKEGKVVYVRGGSFFVIGESIIQEADLATFAVIDEAYAKDNLHIYYDGEPVLGAKPDSVALVPSKGNASGINSGYLVSGDNVFSYGQMIEGADPLNFSLIGGGYAMDNRYIYYYYDEKTPRNVTPTILPQNEYLKHGEQVLYQGKVISTQADHFKVINDEYAKDLLHVYSNGNIVEDMDPSSFKVLSPYFRKDKNQAYYFNYPIKKSDPASFKILNDSISKDQQHLYYESSVIQNKQPATITQAEANDFAIYSKWTPLYLDESTVIMVPSDEVERITYAFFAYHNEIYGRYEKLQGVQPADVFVYERNDKEFVLIGDKVFHNGVQIPDADPETFTPIANNFSKDVHHVYWLTHQVIDADPLTFEPETGAYARENEAGEYVLEKHQF